MGKHRWIDKDDLPYNKGSIDKKNLKGTVVKFKFNDIYGKIKVIDYIYNEKGEGKTKEIVNLSYEGRECLYTLHNFLIANLTRLITPITNNYKIGDVLGEFVVKDFEIKSDIDKNGRIRNRDRLLVECTNCGVIRSVRTDHYKHINKCSDCRNTYKKKKSAEPKVSYGELVFKNYLEHMGITYESEKTFDWSDRKRFDFYLPSLWNGTVTEVMGIQHYEEQNKGQRFHRKLKEQQKIDKWKKDKAIENKLKYIEIDARHSDFTFIKNSIINSNLPTDETNWGVVYYNTFKSNKRVDDIIKKYNEGYTLKQFRDLTGYSSEAIKRTLKELSSLGYIDGYDKYEMEIRYHKDKLKELYGRRSKDVDFIK